MSPGAELEKLSIGFMLLQLSGASVALGLNSIEFNCHVLGEFGD